jgi:glycine/D-amino acid oxidase-like deaminating enzyme
MEPYLEALTQTKYCPLWHDQDDVKPDPHAPLTGDEKCQLLIVGGGFTGLWAALQAKERMPDLDIILIESTFVGDGASGRNGGIIESDLAHGDANSDYYFPNEAQRIDELGRINLKELVESLDRYNIDARYENDGLLEVATRQHHVAEIREQYEESKKSGAEAVWFDQDEVRRQVNSPTYLAGLWTPDKGGIVDPARLCWGLKKALISLGVRFFEGTPMLGIKPKGKGMETRCPNGTITSEKILMATNAFPSPVSQIQKSTIPIWDYQIATEPLSADQLASIGWEKRYAMANCDTMFHYYRLTQDNRITWGGGGSVCYYYGSRTDQGVADPRERFERLSKRFFETFPQLEGVSFTHRWGGIIASSTRFCMVPGVAYDNRVSWSVGYTGLGVAATRFGARVGLELLGYQPTDILDMQFIKGRAMNWPPEPFRWVGVTMTRHAMSKSDANGGKQGLWLKLLDRFNIGFAC